MRQAHTESVSAGHDILTCCERIIAEHAGRKSESSQSERIKNQEGRARKAKAFEHVSNQQVKLAELSGKVDVALGRISNMMADRNVPQSLEKLRGTYASLALKIENLLHANDIAHQRLRDGHPQEEVECHHHLDMQLDDLHHFLHPEDAHHGEISHLEGYAHENSLHLDEVSAERRSELSRDYDRIMGSAESIMRGWQPRGTALHAAF